MHASQLCPRTIVSRAAILLLLVTVPGACAEDPSGGEPEATPVSNPVGEAAEESSEQMEPGQPERDGGVPYVLTRDALADATFRNEMFEAPITLESGEYEEEIVPGSASKLTAVLGDEIAHGDLDGDGDPEAAGILYVNGGGSGTFRYLVVMDEAADEARQLATTILGDRVLIEDLAISSGQVMVEMMVHAEDDPMADPSESETRYYRVEAGQLVEAAVD